MKHRLIRQLQLRPHFKAGISAFKLRSQDQRLSLSSETESALTDCEGRRAVSFATPLNHLALQTQRSFAKGRGEISSGRLSVPLQNIHSRNMGVLWKTAAGIISVFLLCADFSSAASTTVRPHQNCDQYYYFDHGTEHCEHCSDICDKASYYNTVEQCLELCKPYAQMIENQKRKPPNNPTPQPPNKNKNKSNNSTTSEFPPGAWIGVIALGLVCTLVSGVFLLKRRDIMNKIRGNNHIPTVPNQTAVFIPPQQPPDPARMPGVGSAASTVGGGSGTQEEGEPCGEGAGNHSYHILPLGVPESVPLLKLQPSTPAPVPVSPEGQNGGHDMALASTSHDHPFLGSGLFPPSSDYTPLAFQYNPLQSDLDSTEPKTLQASLEPIECLIPGADGEMLSTTI